MVAYNILEARNNLSRLVASVESGAEITIMRRGKAVAKLVPVGDEPSPRPNAAITDWLRTHPLPARLARTRDDLDEAIAENRDAWE